ncbi:Uncharacterized protein Fot_35193 [Forsythia ovata]|uniref:Uncharacterized protein n=1 Tax=Forsythia ovata TaxID=205694 RepID=A0ABD1SL40_9LAMI
MVAKDSIIVVNRDLDTMVNENENWLLEANKELTKAKTDLVKAEGREHVRNEAVELIKTLTPLGDSTTASEAAKDSISTKGTTFEAAKDSAPIKDTTDPSSADA